MDRTIIPIGRSTELVLLKYGSRAVIVTTVINVFFNSVYLTYIQVHGIYKKTIFANKHAQMH